jgi:hypothetical protein
MMGAQGITCGHRGPACGSFETRPVYRPLRSNVLHVAAQRSQRPKRRLRDKHAVSTQLAIHAESEVFAVGSKTVHHHKQCFTHLGYTSEVTLQ